MFKSAESRARYLAAYDEVLAGWPIPFEALDVPTHLGSAHVIASGPSDAPPLVLLPSFAGTATVWRLNVAGLSCHFRTYAVDVIGQPGKSIARRRLRTRRQYADWLSDLLEGLGVARTSIVGSSFGGFLALNQALLAPARVDRLVLISPAGSFVGLSWTFAFVMRTAPLRRWLRRVAGDQRRPDITDLSLRRPMRAPRDEKWRVLMSVTMAEAAKVSIINATVFSRSQLRAILAPTLLLIGDAERLYPPVETLALARERMPSLKGAIVPDADHIAAMAQPDDVNARILTFLQAER
jgi:pimeloyl-ACP methyl ester carboxylesterase